MVPEVHLRLLQYLKLTSECQDLNRRYPRSSWSKVAFQASALAITMFIGPLSWFTEEEGNKTEEEQRSERILKKVIDTCLE